MFTYMQSSRRISWLEQCDRKSMTFRTGRWQLRWKNLEVSPAFHVYRISLFTNLHGSSFLLAFIQFHVIYYFQQGLVYRTRHSLTGWMIALLCLRTSGHYASSRFGTFIKSFCKHNQKYLSEVGGKCKPVYAGDMTWFLLARLKTKV